MQAKNFGEFIKRKRISLGLSQEVLAQKLNITQGYVTRIENGRQVPSHDLIIDISKVLQVRSGTLFQYLDEEQPEQENEQSKDFQLWLQGLNPSDEDYETIRAIAEGLLKRNRLI